METLINKFIELMAVFGIGVVLVFVAGFWLFYRLKQDAEKQDRARERNQSLKP